jgi:hypothetical protein
VVALLKASGKNPLMPLGVPLKQTCRLFVMNEGGSRTAWDWPMCEKSVEIDKTIEWYRKIQRSISDQKTIDGTEKLIADLEAKKAAFHTERK